LEIRIPIAILTDYCAEIFGRVGCNEDEARRVATSLVGANLTGHDSHGVIRVPRYVDWVHSGDLVPNQTIEILVDAPSFAVVDGRYGFGHSVTPPAVNIGIAKAKEGGLAAVALRNSGHLGRVGQWAERAAGEGLISIHFVNVSGSALVAPFGAMERRFSTAPFCVGVPREGAEPVVLDFATSLVAEGKAAVAFQGGKPLPSNALIGPDGQPSGDPAPFYQGLGALRAFGEHKGSGLALICELIGGSLTGTGATGPGKRFANGMFSIYVDAKRVNPDKLFDADVSEFLTWVQAAKPIPGQKVLTPGEPERIARADRSANGAPMPEETWASIMATARKLGIERQPLGAS
jgi:hydroxycarboxylate dehydrogenase B